MSWDELLEGVFSGYFKVKDRLNQKKKQALITAQNTVRLKDIQNRLTILARAITGSPINIYPAEREGGYKNNDFFLPVFYAGFDNLKDNLQFYLFRTIYLSIQKQLNYNWPPEQKEDLENSRQKALETAPQVLKQLFDEFSNMQNIHDKLVNLYQTPNKKNQTPDLSFIYGKWMTNRIENQETENLKHINEKVKKAINDEIKTTLKAQAVEEMETIQVDKKQQADQVVNNYYEKIETLEEHKGGIWKDFDGDDELEAHQNALQELKMSRTVRVDEDTHSVYQTEFIENITVSENVEIDAKDYYIPYDEWDSTKRRYKPDFCKLYPKKVDKRDTAYYKKTIADYQTTLTGLRKMLANMHNRYREHRRQLQGDHFDLDAVTEMMTDIYAKRTPDERIYISKRKTEKDLSILLLLDISLSSDGYAAGNRVIDVEKQVSILFGEILNEFEVDFSINAFFSKTRHYSTFLTLKAFDENWQNAKYKIGTPQPQGYTRIGTALRHAGSLLDQRPTKNKWVILISDGKPNDYDRYEGKYGIQDVKQALRELKSKNINSYALAIEAEAKYYLPQMFGQNHYQILTSPVALLESLVKLYEKIRH